MGKRAGKERTRSRVNIISNRQAFWSASLWMNYCRAAPDRAWRPLRRSRVSVIRCWRGHGGRNWTRSAFARSTGAQTSVACATGTKPAPSREQPGVFRPAAGESMLPPLLRVRALVRGMARGTHHWHDLSLCSEMSQPASPAGREALLALFCKTISDQEPRASTACRAGRF